MKKTVIALMLGLSAAPFTHAAGGPFANAGFEDVSLNGWTVNEPALASVVSSYLPTYYGSALPPYITPIEGSYFLILKGGLGPNVETTATKSFSLKAGDTLIGYAGFVDEDHPFADYASVTIDGPSGPVELFYADGGGYYPGDRTGWTEWSFTAPAAGRYTLTYAAANDYDNNTPSSGYFDLFIVQ